MKPVHLRRGLVLLGLQMMFAVAVAAQEHPVAMPSKVAALVKQLKSDDAEMRGRAAAELARLGATALPALPALLGCFDDTTSLWRLEGATQSHTSVRDEALGAIRSIGPRATPELLRAVEDLGRPAGLRAFAAAALAELKDSRAVPALISSLQDANKDVAEEGARALGKIGDRRAVDPLIPLLTHTQLSVASAAAEALGSLRDPRAVQPLLSALPVWNERHWGGLAAELRNFAQDPRVVPALVDQLHRNGDVIGAATVLGELRSSAAVDALIPHLKDSQPARCSAAEALGLIKDIRAVGPLINALTSETDGTAEAYEIEALQRITGQRLGSERRRWLEWWKAQRQPH